MESLMIEKAQRTIRVKNKYNKEGLEKEKNLDCYSHP
jgi:hypothetical protein